MQVQLVLHESLADGMPAAHGLARVFAELLPLAGQLNRAAVAHEQWCAEFVLELLDAATERGGADMLLAAGFAEVQVVCQGKKELEGVAVHERFSYRHIALRIYHFTQWVRSLNVPLSRCAHPIPFVIKESGT
ncbi:hypothetical protein D3C85_1496210 [compost metagenome]